MLDVIYYGGLIWELFLRELRFLFIHVDLSAELLKSLEEVLFFNFWRRFINFLFFLVLWLFFRAVNNFLILIVLALQISILVITFVEGLRKTWGDFYL